MKQLNFLKDLENLVKPFEIFETPPQGVKNNYLVLNSIDSTHQSGETDIVNFTVSVDFFSTQDIFEFFAILKSSILSNIQDSLYNLIQLDFFWKSEENQQKLKKGNFILSINFFEKE